MKIYELLFGLFLFVAFSDSIAAQKTLDKGAIDLQIKDIESDNPQIAQAAEMMKQTKVHRPHVQ